MTVSCNDCVNFSSKGLTMCSQVILNEVRKPDSFGSREA